MPGKRDESRDSRGTSKSVKSARLLSRLVCRHLRCQITEENDLIYLHLCWVRPLVRHNDGVLVWIVPHIPYKQRQHPYKTTMTNVRSSLNVRTILYTISVSAGHEGLEIGICLAVHCITK